jgi:GTP-binding protein HflX
MKRVFGHITGLKANQIRRLENLYRRRVPPEQLATRQQIREICGISRDLRCQIGLLITRQGKISHVIVGDHQRIVIPDLSHYRSAPGRLKGLRCVHTHLTPDALSQEDLTDLALLRLDLMAAVTVSGDGSPRGLHVAHILPRRREGQRPYHLMDPLDPLHPDIGCRELIRALETELEQARVRRAADSNGERAILVAVTTEAQQAADRSLTELKDLARSAGLSVVGVVRQSRRRGRTRFLLGAGKLQELTILVLQQAATLIVFDQELNASQIRSITNQIDLKVIDRTQLILDIFAQRAQTRAGKLQVELAQLKYMLPRLVTKNTAMSRLTGGIGGRGPGETKLEINRRRARERIARLESALKQVRRHRQRQRSRRDKRGLPILSIIGYTNAGKSTLLNTLTKSRVHAENRLFATLDPSSRRLRFPQDMEVIVTDTVGFIRDLPKDLMVAFRATLEELSAADLLLHVVDISSPDADRQAASVNRILAELSLDRLPQIFVLNKIDRVDADQRRRLLHRFGGVPICARDAKTLTALMDAIQDRVATTFADRFARPLAVPAAADKAPGETGSGSAPDGRSDSGGFRVD